MKQKGLLLFVFACFLFIQGKAQYFENEYTVGTKKMPVIAYLYKYSAPVVFSSSEDIWGAYEVEPVVLENGRKYFRFPGHFIDSALLGQANIIFYIDHLDEDKSILYLSAVKKGTEDYMPALRNGNVVTKFKNYFETIELHCVDVVKRQYLSDQYQKIFELKNEIQALTDELGRVEDETPNATTRITRLRNTIRLRKMKLDEENQILENLQQMNN